jgi:hypothetical protein
MTVNNAETIQIGTSIKRAIAPCPQSPHPTQNNIGKKHSRMTTANVLSQTPLDPHRAPKTHGMAGKTKDGIIKRVIRTPKFIFSARLAFSIALPTH